ncbi:MAG: carboxypeptidase-like regulatory domain-containing protein, partial [Terracidiphilus sp.]
MQLISAKSLRALMLVILAALVGSGVLVYGQGTSGSLTGQVSDPSGAAVNNATVSLKNVDTDYLQTATSNNAGVYLLKPVMP